MQHGFLIEMVAFRERVRIPPFVKWMQKIVDVLACTTKEVAQVVIVCSHQAVLTYLRNVSFPLFPAKERGNGRWAGAVAELDRLPAICLRWEG